MCILIKVKLSAQTKLLITSYCCILICLTAHFSVLSSISSIYELHGMPFTNPLILINLKKSHWKPWKGLKFELNCSSHWSGLEFNEFDPSLVKCLNNFENICSVSPNSDELGASSQNMRFCPALHFFLSHTTYLEIPFRFGKKQLLFEKVWTTSMMSSTQITK